MAVISRIARWVYTVAVVQLCYSSTIPPSDPDSTKCPTVCPPLYEPVCGSDGNTYANECQLNLVTCQGPLVHKVADGDCDGVDFTLCNLNCPGIYEPVCGSDGNTYDNGCLLETLRCQSPQIYKLSDGECEESEEPCSDSCGDDYSPVCGSNGVTYDNDCSLSLAVCTGTPVTKVYDGACEVDQTCPQSCDDDTYQPICGSDGNTYINDCELNRTTCQIPSIVKIADGACEESTEAPPCPDNCPRTYEPVCGNDGVTYENVCDIGVAICQDSFISKVADGECYSDTYECKYFCDNTNKPVCGTDGNTYHNLCELDYAKCKDASISKLADGACGNLSGTSTPLEDPPTTTSYQYEY